VFRDIKTTTVTHMRDVHIRDKIIKDWILLGSLFTVWDVFFKDRFMLAPLFLLSGHT
jgi:hypothetical protein